MEIRDGLRRAWEYTNVFDRSTRALLAVALTVPMHFVYEAAYALTARALSVLAPGAASNGEAVATVTGMVYIVVFLLSFSLVGYLVSE